MEVGVEEVYPPGSEFDLPRRPPWNYSMTKSEVETAEQEMFKSYLSDIYSKYSTPQLSYFEHNLEVQCIMIRSPVVHFLH